MRHFFSYLGPKESRLMFHERPVFSIGPREQSDEQQSSPETLPDVQLHCAPSTTMQQKMNEAGECLGASRAEYNKNLLQHYKYLTTRIQKLRFPFGYKAEARDKALYRSFTEKNAGKNYKNEPYQNELIAIRDKEIHELEMELQKVTSEMARMKAEEAAGFPDVAPSPIPIPPAPPPTTPAGQAVERPTILGTGERPAPRAQTPLAAFQAKAPKEAVEAVMGLDESLREAAATLFDGLSESETKTMISLCERMKDADIETLNAFFTLYFKEGTVLPHDKVEIDEKIAGAREAKAFSALLSGEERAMIEKFMKKKLDSMEKVETFEDMKEVTKTRILKYVKRWNTPRSEGDKLIAEGMLYLDGVDVETTPKKDGGIDQDRITLLGKDQRFMGMISGWIKVFMGWKKLFGGMTKPDKEKKEELKEPKDMTPEEKSKEVTENKQSIKDIEARNKILPEEIKGLQKKLESLGADDPEAQQRIRDEIAAKEKIIAEGKKKVEELEKRNKELEGVKADEKEGSKETLADAKDPRVRFREKIKEFKVEFEKDVIASVEKMMENPDVSNLMIRLGISDRTKLREILTKEEILKIVRLMHAIADSMAMEVSTDTTKCRIVMNLSLVKAAIIKEWPENSGDEFNDIFVPGLRMTRYEDKAYTEFQDVEVFLREDDMVKGLGALGHHVPILETKGEEKHELTPALKNQLGALVSSIDTVYKDFENIKNGRMSYRLEKEIDVIHGVSILAAELLLTIPDENIELKKDLERVADTFGRFTVSDIGRMVNDDFDHWLATFDAYREDLKKHSGGLVEVPKKVEEKEETPRQKSQSDVLKALGGSLVVEKDLNIGSTGLIPYSCVLPENLKINGSLDVSGQAVVIIPGSVEIRDDLVIGYPSLINIESSLIEPGLSVGKNVYISYNDDLPYIALETILNQMASIKIGGNIVISGMDKERLEIEKKNHPKIAKKMVIR